MKFSDAGIAWLAKYEGFRSRSYQDQAGIWTIGYGTISLNGQPVTEGMEVNQLVALALMRGNFTDTVAAINRLVIAPITQDQFDALVSLAYNIGTGAFAGSTVLKVINSGGRVTEDMFTRWNKVRVNGVLVESNGLELRRRSEYERFSGGLTQSA
jgi:lysozyme